jgi:siroheme synthase (precorrin-2 oxidase/ferrochelatase)
MSSERQLLQRPQVLIVGAGPTGLERAPDFVLRKHATRERTSLFELLRTGRPVVLIGAGKVSQARLQALLESMQLLSIDAWLIFGRDETGRAQHERGLTDIYNELDRLYGLRDEFLLLVRPDDHIGLIQAPIDERRLGDYLTQICPAATM